MSDVIPETAAKQIADCLYAGRKIEAIKLYREQTGKGLKEAKEFVEALEKELRVREPAKFTVPPGGKGCLGMIMALGLGAASMAAVLVAAALYTIK